MLDTTPYVLRVCAPQGGTSVRPYLTAAEAYDGATVVRRTVGDAGTLLQVEDVQSGDVLGQWRRDETCWLLDDTELVMHRRAR